MTGTTCQLVTNPGTNVRPLGRDWVGLRDATCRRVRGIDLTFGASDKHNIVAYAPKEGPMV